MSTITVLENESLAAGHRRTVVARGQRNLTIDSGSVGNWSIRKHQQINYGNLQTGLFVTVAVFQINEPEAEATLIVDTDGAGDAASILAD